MRILVIDIGGNNVKLLATGQTEKTKIPSGPELTPNALVAAIGEATLDWDYEAVSIGYPGPVRGGRPALEPHNLGNGWVDFDFGAAFGRPARVINDAAMQALGSYDGGRMLFLGLGTGLGSAMVVCGIVQPLELAHLPYKSGRTFEQHVGEAALERVGKKRWTRVVFDVTERLCAALQADYVVIGGGNVKKLDELPPGARRGSNANAFVGGFRMWEPASELRHESAPITATGEPVRT